MGIGNIVIVKPSPSSYYSTRDMEVSKEAYIDIWQRRGGERILETARD